jgi:hypothetical protein
MARPGHHPGVFMALALPAYPAEAVGVHQSPGRILAGRGGCGRGWPEETPSSANDLQAADVRHPGSGRDRRPPPERG